MALPEQYREIIGAMHRLDLLRRISIRDSARGIELHRTQMPAGKRRFDKGDFTRKMKSPHKLDFALLFPVTFRNNEAVSTDFNKPFTVIHRRMDME